MKAAQVAGLQQDIQRGTNIMVSGYGVKAETKEIGILIVFIIGIILVLPWLLKKLITSTGEAAADTAKDLLAIPGKYVSERVEKQDIAVSAKITAAQEAYKAHPYLNLDGTPATLNQWAQHSGLLAEASVKAVELMPYGGSILAQAGGAGAEFRGELVASGDEARYEALDPVSKGLVTMGEGLSKTFTGFDPYKAGQKFGSWLGTR